MKHYPAILDIGTDARLVSKAHAARLLGLSQRSVRRLVQRGVLAEVDLGPGTRPRIRVADVLELSQASRGEVTTATADSSTP